MMKYLIEKEIKQFFRNPFLPRAALFIPVAIILILPLVATMDVRNVKVCIVDNDGSTASQRLAGLIDASGYFVLTGMESSYDLGLARMEYGNADIILSIPDGFEKNLLEGGGAEVLISANATDATKGGLGGSYLSAIVADYAARYVSELNGFTPGSPTISQLNLFNPGMNYRTFMLPALMGMIVIVIGCVFTAIAIVSEKEKGTLEQINVTPVSRSQFIMAKQITYFAVGMIVLSIAFLLAWLVYSFKPVGSFVTIYAASILMIAAMSSLGLIISNYSNNFQQAIYLFFIIMITSLLMSGLWTPATSMPPWAQAISAFMPPKYFMIIMRGAYLKGSGFIHLWKEFLALGLFAIGFGAAAIATYRKRS